MIFVGLDPTDPYARRKRPCTRALLTQDLQCSFDEWEYDVSGQGILLPSNVEMGFVLAVDGPQGLAMSADRTMRACERQLGVAGKSPYTFPPIGRPFAGFITGSVKLFHEICTACDFCLYGFPDIDRSEANLIEVYPGAAWKVLAHENLPKKRSREGREHRFRLLIGQGITFPEPASWIVPTHDELDAAMAAYTAYLFAEGRTTDHGEPPFDDAGSGVLREGFIVQPVLSPTSRGSA